MLKNGMPHQIMMEERIKIPLHVGKSEKVVGLMKNERGGKIITICSTPAPKNFVIEYRKMIMK